MLCQPEGMYFILLAKDTISLDMVDCDTATTPSPTVPTKNHIFGWSYFPNKNTPDLISFPLRK